MTITGASAQNKGSEVSCGSWTAERKVNSVDSYIYQAWVAGFISAYNAWSPNAEGNQVSTDTDGIFGWIDNHCQAKPLDTLINATSKLIMEIQK